MTLADQLRDSIQAGLMRRSVTSCSKWAEKYRVMSGGPWSFKYYPWTRGMHDSTATFNIGRKSAQVGYTETALNITFFQIDVRRTDVLYVLPNKSPDASDFSAARFDAALELSPHLQDLFSDVKNVGHKRAGPVNLYVRGSRSRSGLVSIPVGTLILDERDAMSQESVNLAIERLSGQFHKLIWEVSTPTLENFGIDKDFKISTQEHFMFRCPRCSRFTELSFPECFVCPVDSLTDPRIHESYIQCRECKMPLPHEAKHAFLADGQWQPTAQCDPDIRGFYVNQLYSSTIRPVDFARSMIRAQFSPTDEQEFFNSKLGLPHEVKGARISDSEIQQCTANYRSLDTAPPNSVITMGVDVGSWLHVEIVQWTLPDTLGPDLSTNARARVLKALKVRNFEDLDKLMRQYQVQGCVVDMFPERRKAKEFADRFYGYVKLCYYGRGVASKGIRVPSQEKDLIEDHQITVDRTSWLDLSLGRFHNQTITIPSDVPAEYKEHLKNQARIYEKDSDGNPVGRYVSIDADHYGHARNYSEIALPLAASIVTATDIGAFL